MALTKVTEASENEGLVQVGTRCVLYARPINTAPQPSGPVPPDINWGGSTDPAPPSDKDCSNVNVFNYRDPLGRCWRVLEYPCTPPNEGNIVRSPIDCADL